MCDCICKHLRVDVGVELKRILSGVERENYGICETQCQQTQMLRDSNLVTCEISEREGECMITNMLVETGICVHLLPHLRVIDRVVVVRRVCRSTTKALIRAGNLQCHNQLSTRQEYKRRTPSLCRKTV